jgi:hypothetical protein
MWLVSFRTATTAGVTVPALGLVGAGRPAAERPALRPAAVVAGRAAWTLPPEAVWSVHRTPGHRTVTRP